MALKIEASCEIGDLIDEVVTRSGRKYEEVERAMFKVGKYPESTKTFIYGDTSVHGKPDYEWLYGAFTSLLAELGLLENGLYITNAI